MKTIALLYKNAHTNFLFFCGIRFLVLPLTLVESLQDRYSLKAMILQQLDQLYLL